MKIKTSSNLINQACDIAFSDIGHNIRPYKSGLLEKEQRVILAGSAYNRPWTRDTSINVYNALAYYNREVALNTLLSVLERREVTIQLFLCIFVVANAFQRKCLEGII